MSYVYLASPYSHPLEDIRIKRFNATAAAVGQMMEQYGQTIYSPIVHYHSVYPYLIGAPTTADFWWPHNRNMLRHASFLRVLQLPGWQKSDGIKREINFARKHLDLMIEYIWPDESIIELLA